MHDGDSINVDKAIRRHTAESRRVRERFLNLKPADKKALLTFLQSL